MKLVILFAVVAACAAAPLYPYSPFYPNAYYRNVGDYDYYLNHPELLRNNPELFRNNPELLRAHPELLRNYPELLRNYPELLRNYPNYYNQYPRARAELDRNARIINSESDADGLTYRYSFDTENGIHAEQTGIEAGGTQAKGAYSYVGDDGKTYTVKYTAGADGFRAEGEHIPTSPPIPEAIAKSLELNAKEEALKGKVDDGSYKPETDPYYRNALYNQYLRGAWDPEARRLAAIYGYL